MDRRGLITGSGLRCELGIELDGRLSVIHLQLDFATQQATCGVDVLNGKLGGLGHGRSIDVEAA